MKTLEDMTAGELALNAIRIIVKSKYGVYAAQRLVRRHLGDLRQYYKDDIFALMYGPGHPRYEDAEACISNWGIRINNRHWDLDWHEGAIIAYDSTTIREWEKATGQVFWDHTQS